MEAVIEPEGWNDLDMDWTDPDPTKVCYYLAILKAMDERRRAFSASGGTPWRHPELIYKRNRFHIPSVRMLRNWMDDILTVTSSYCAVRKEDFMNYESFGPSRPTVLQERFTPVVTYPVPGIGSPLSQAKEFLKWARKVLDTTTMFLYPVIKVNYYTPDTSDINEGSHGFSKTYEGDINEIPNILEWRERSADLFINEFSDRFVIKSATLDAPFLMRISSDIYDYLDEPVIGYDVRIGFTQEAFLPESIEIRSFAQPHVYCLAKPYVLYYEEFEDFGYGFENGRNKVFDLGQVSKDNGVKFDLFKFNLEDMKPYLLRGSAQHRLGLNVYLYFALDYNCEGGFKFRPDDTN